jgi:hypothetical protein
MGERRPLAPFLHGFMGALPDGDDEGIRSIVNQKFPMDANKKAKI